MRLVKNTVPSHTNSQVLLEMAGKGKMSAWFVVLLAVFLLTLAGMLVVPFLPYKEMFGAQGGEMVQLAAGHVPTEEDAEEMNEWNQQVERDLIDMTGSA
jgi:hypothetical protein